jgi:tetratricopeptide (TPR) repeat protein
MATAGMAPEVASLLERQRAEVQKHPKSGEAWGRLGGLLKSCNLASAAVVCLNEAARLAPGDPRWPFLRGTLPGPADEVTSALGRAAQLTGFDPEAPRLRWIRALIEAGRADEARRAAEALARARPDCPPARLYLAQLHQAKGEWREAVAAAQAGGCAESPFTARAAATLLAVAYGRMGDTNAAERAARQATILPADASWPDPFEEEVLAWRNDPRSLSDRAQNHLLGGRPEAARPLIEQLAREHPNFAETWLLLGRAQYLQRRPREAETTLRRHLQMDPTSVNGHFQLGMALLAQQEFLEATKSFQKAIDLKPDFGPAYFNLAFALARMGQNREAVEPFRQAIRHSPEKIDSYILLADLHVQLGEPAEAARLAALAAQLDPNDRRLPDLRQKLAR